MAGNRREARFIITAENRAAAALQDATRDVHKLDGAFGAMGKTALKAGAGVLSIGAGISAIKAIINTTAEFEKLKASLVTVTGSVDGAEAAFQQIQDFAGSTPYALTEVTEAFIKLKNYGLDPSEEALRAYGDTASSMGKSLNDFIEAVADASSGEFERLKEFGIKSSKEGQKVIFTFRGVKTEIANNSEEIQKYLIKLGQTNFSGAMERQAATLSGKFGALSDEYDKLKYNIGKNGLGDAVGKGVQETSGFLADLNKNFALVQVFADGAAKSIQLILTLAQSGESALIAVISHISSYVLEFAALAVDGIGTTIPLAFKSMLEAGEDAITGLKQGFRDFGIGSVNLVIKGINSAIEAVDKLINEAAKSLSKFLDGASMIPGVGKISFSYSQKSALVDPIPWSPVKPADLGSSAIEPFGQDLSAWFREQAEFQEGQALYNLDMAEKRAKEARGIFDEIINPDMAQYLAKNNVPPPAVPTPTPTPPPGEDDPDKKGPAKTMKDLKEAAEDTGDAIKETFNILDEYGKAVTSSLESSIEDFTKNGKLDVAEFGRSILSELAAITAKAAILGGILGNTQYGGNGQGLVGSVLSAYLTGGTQVPKAVAVGSYEGGGFTGFGARSGGVDGRGGFAAVLHPNETVIDHTRSDSSGGSSVVHQTVIIRETMPAGQARAIMAASSQRAVAEVVNRNQRGGNRRKALR